MTLKADQKSLVSSPSIPILNLVLNNRFDTTFYVGNEIKLHYEHTLLTYRKYDRFLHFIDM